MENQKKHPEYQYLDLVKDIIENGSDKPVFFTPEVLEEYKKKGEEAPFIRSVFGRQIRFNLNEGFPLLTTKKVFLKGIIHELLWFLKGDSNIKYLVDNKVKIWDEWAWKRYHKHCLENCPEKDMDQASFIEKLRELPADDPFVVEWGDLITIYGRMWRRWPASDGREIDQLGWVIEGLKDKPFRKSYVVSAWNPDFIYAMASKGNVNEVPPFCHTMFQFSVTDGNKLNLGMYQRSADVFLGVPFNIASYALLLQMVAQVTGLEVGEYVHTFGDVHSYSNHFDQVKEQLSREPRPFPTIKINPEVKNIDDFKFEDFEIVPVLLGSIDPLLLTDIFSTYFSRENCIFIFSSDLSHYENYTTAAMLDNATIDTILNLDINHPEYLNACGKNSLLLAMSLALKHGMQISLLDKRTSGDTTGNKDSVVGYSSLIIHK